MMTTLEDLLDRSHANDITERARTFRPGAVFAAVVGGTLRLLLAVVAGSLWGAGWGVWKLISGAWFVLAWMVAAVVTGWLEAGGPARKPKPADGDADDIRQ